MSQQTKDLTLLGNQNVAYAQDYAPEVLETFENKHQDNDYFVKFIAKNIKKKYNYISNKKQRKRNLIFKAISLDWFTSLVFSYEFDKGGT